MATHRSAEPLRQLSASDLGIGAAPAIKAHSSNRPDDPPLPDDHPLLIQSRNLLSRFGGIIFTGPPGTSKSYYAAKIATTLANDPSRVRFTQFHPSYQYEDFMQGFVPKDDGTGFSLEPKHFVRMCRDAAKPGNEALTFVLVIDELSRGDPGRVFGEALTYVEKSKRGLEFDLASGETLKVPDNLLILATMNPLDRGVDEVDAAFERRFAKIEMLPDREILGELLDRNGVVVPLKARIMSFFNMLNGRARNNPQAPVGHTYFADVTDETTLQMVWDHQLTFLVEKAFRLDPETRDEVAAAWASIFDAPAPNVGPSPSSED